MQELIVPGNAYAGLDAYLERHQITRLFLVCGNSIAQLPLWDHLTALEQRRNIRIFRFSDFHPNPNLSSVQLGAAQYIAHACSGIAAVGGGSAIDVAKCIWREIGTPDTPLLAIPTTAGSGSEATSFAVIYKNGVKQSVGNCLPNAAMLDPTLLRTLPLYQRKATLLDALCHGIESCWSMHATPESRAYSVRAIRQVLEHAEGYLTNQDAGNAGMLQAANLAGKAIHIAKTTAAHAMCYRLTTLFGVAHGHAAALCLSALFPELLRHSLPEQAAAALREITAAMNCPDGTTAAQKFAFFLHAMHLPRLSHEIPITPKALAASVDPDRLANTPIPLGTTDLCRLYEQILHT